MNTKAVALSAVALLVLSGCASTAASPQATVTVTAEATETVTAKPQTTNAPSSSSKRADFEMYMSAVDVPRYILNSDTMMDTLYDIGQTTCDLIDSGSDPDEVTFILTLASDGMDDDVVYAGLAAAVAATYSICPEYSYFWD